MYTPFDAANWSGRDDGPGAEHARWHSVIKGLDPARAGEVDPAVALLGFASDEGVERNGGRRGAAGGPAALRGALAGLAVHDAAARFDAGTVTTEDPDLEAAQRELSDRVGALVAAGHLVFALGGGHETAWATHRGLFEAVHGAEASPGAGTGDGASGGAAARRLPEGTRIAVVNLDAHFDLRQADRPTSGTPFLQIAQLHGAQVPGGAAGEHGADSRVDGGAGDGGDGAAAGAGRGGGDGSAAGAGDFDYTVLGISRPNNTRVLFETAERLGVRTVLDDEVAALTPQQAGELVAEAVSGADHVHLSIDLDGLPASVAPGVSAPAAVGVDLAHYRAMAAAAADSGKLRLVDLAELNPKFDVDGRTAKVAARLIADIEARAAAARG